MPAFQPSIALAAYAESVADGRRVLVVGDALGALPDLLLQRGARFVHVCDTDPLRVARASAQNRAPNISFAPLADGQVALQGGAFDLAIVENLGAADAVSVVRRVRRSLGARGIGIFACPNPEARLPLLEVPEPGAVALDYYALYDAVAADFSVVRMLGQAPFVGYAIADFAPNGEPEPAIDSGFVPGGAEEPDWFVALAAQHALELERFYVVQLPTRGVLPAGGAVANADVQRRARDEQRALKQRISELEKKLLEAAGAREGEPSPNPALERELARQNAWIVELEARASTADERADRAEAELEELRSQTDAKVAELLRSQAALLKSEAELRESEALLEKRLGEVQAAPTDDTASEIAEFERQLSERGAELRRLERELREAERLGRELLRQRQGLANVPRAEVHRLATEIARREADLVAAGWAVDALLGRREGVEERAGGSDQGLDETLADAQRRAVLAAQIEGAR